MEKSKKLYIGGIIVELVAILISITYVYLPQNAILAAFLNIDLLLLITATTIFLMGTLCVTFGRNAEKSETWYRNVSVVFSAYENARAKVT